jgi:hypothetical protein
MANNGGGAAIPTEVNGVPMIIPAGTQNLAPPVATTDPYAEGQAFGAPTVTQTFNAPVRQHGNGGNRGNNRGRR